MLAELLIVLLLSTLATTFALRQAVKDAETLSAKALGEQTAMLAQGLESYIFNNYAALSVGDPVLFGDPAQKIANPLAPTYQELLAAKYIDLNVGNKSVFGQNFVFKVETANCPGLTCNVFGYVYTDRPVLQANGRTINEGIAITALQTIGFRGGVTYTNTPNIISGLGGQPKGTVNPAAGQAGLVFAFAGSNASPFSAFYKKAGDTLLGPMEGNNQKIQNLELMTAKKFSDTDVVKDSLDNVIEEFFVDPSDESRFKTISGQKFRDTDVVKDALGNVIEEYSLDPSGDSKIKTATIETATMKSAIMDDGLVKKRSSKINLSDLLSMDVVQTSGAGITSPKDIDKPICADVPASQPKPTPLIDVSLQAGSSPEGVQVQIIDIGLKWRVQILEGAGGIPLSGSIFSYRTYCRYDKS